MFVILQCLLSLLVINSKPIMKIFSVIGIYCILHTCMYSRSSFTNQNACLIPSYPEKLILLGYTMYVYCRCIYMYIHVHLCMYVLCIYIYIYYVHAALRNVN